MCQISEAISAYRPSGPEFSASNNRTNSACTTRKTLLADSQSRSRGRVVPASGSYSSLFLFSNAIPIGSCRKRSAATESNNYPYSAFGWRRSFRISSRVLSIAWFDDETNTGMCVDVRFSSPRHCHKTVYSPKGITYLELMRVGRQSARPGSAIQAGPPMEGLCCSHRVTVQSFGRWTRNGRTAQQ
jgi:hypothetical protein